MKNFFKAKSIPKPLKTNHLKLMIRRDLYQPPQNLCQSDWPVGTDRSESHAAFAGSEASKLPEIFLRSNGRSAVL
jgi:hypothetical protein